MGEPLSQPRKMAQFGYGAFHDAGGDLLCSQVRSKAMLSSYPTFCVNALAAGKIWLC